MVEFLPLTSTRLRKIKMVKLNVKKALILLPFTLTSLMLWNHFWGSREPLAQQADRSIGDIDSVQGNGKTYILPKANIEVLVSPEGTLFIANQAGKQNLACKSLVNDGLLLDAESQENSDAAYYRVKGTREIIGSKGVLSDVCEIERVRDND